MNKITLLLLTFIFSCGVEPISTGPYGCTQVDGCYVYEDTNYEEKRNQGNHNVIRSEYQERINCPVCETTECPSVVECEECELSKPECIVRLCVKNKEEHHNTRWETIEINCLDINSYVGPISEVRLGLCIMGKE